FCKALGSIESDNTQKEYYLTDTIEYMVKNSFLVEALQTKDAVQLLGINTQEDLHLAEKIITEQIGSS
ncbi:MAG: nucleotidyl transferase, partial [Nitrospina sp.]|nr:nucleotidyl transferase [Nitrospina sp.]